MLCREPEHPTLTARASYLNSDKRRHMTLWASSRFIPSAAENEREILKVERQASRQSAQQMCEAETPTEKAKYIFRQHDKQHWTASGDAIRPMWGAN